MSRFRLVILIAAFHWVGLVSASTNHAVQVPSGSETPIKQSADTNVFRRENLVAWCIVPFDEKKRNPRERAEMLTRLGISRLAYDYRAEHVASFDEEIRELQSHGVELTAWWFPTALNDEGRLILNLLDTHKIKTQLWVMGDGEPADSSPEAIAKHIDSEVARIREIALAAAKIGCTVGLYNHGGWFGEPANQMAIIERLQLKNVGIVYNLHHGHAHLARFRGLLEKMKPHLLCLNLNGMDWRGDTVNRKIMPIGAGHLDEACLRIVRDSGYAGPIGILNHTDHDAEVRLRENLDGLGWLEAKISNTHSEPPTFPTWPEGPAEQAASLVELTSEERTEVEALLKRARDGGDSARGLTVFAGLKTSCFSCHKFGRFGGELGPDLTTIAKTRAPEEIAAAILWPNKTVEDKHRITIAQLLDGTTVRGYKRREDERSITIRDPATAVDSVIARSDIDDMRLGLSLMPEELLAALSPRQQGDLLRFLLDADDSRALSIAEADEVLEYATTHRPQKFSFVRDPLRTEDWPSWQSNVNRDRIYDFYTKQAEHFRQHPHSSVLAPAPQLDGDKYGHWGNQNEATWQGNEWNEAVLGNLQCGVFHGDGITVTRGICVKVGEHSVCFNPDRLQYELVWKGDLKFSDVRHGFLDGIQQDGPTTDRPAAREIKEPFRFLGFYRVEGEVIFAYRIGDAEFLDTPRVVDGRLQQNIVSRGEHPIGKTLVRGGRGQWPATFETKIKLGDEAPFAIDTIELPVKNPWNVPLFGGGLGFAADGSAYYSTMTGEVWLVKNFFASPGKAQPTEANWRKFADGLHQPLGLLVDDEGIFVMCRDQLVRLHDYNQDGEADYYECYANCFQTSSSGHDYICGLERDSQGNFYSASGNQGALKISADGAVATVLATGFRNPDGIGLYPDGVVTVPCSEGDWTPASMICAVRPQRQSSDEPQFFGHRGPKNNRAPELPMVYLPRLLDNSAGGQVFVPPGHWGPLGNKMLHLSYGMGSHFLVLRDEVAGQMQGAVVPLAGEFLAGAHRGRFHPIDGQLYVCGMGGWGNYSPDLGCFQRVRWNAKTANDLQIPTGHRVHENGVAIEFSQPLDVEQASRIDNHFAQCWNYRYSGAYGSPEYSTRHFGHPGHDVLEIAAVHVLDNGRTMFLELPDLQPVNQLHLCLNLGDHRGQDLFVTVHKLDKPRTDLPGYQPRAKTIGPHPILVDMAVATASVPNPWNKALLNARKIEIEAAKNLTYSTPRLRAKAGEVLELTFKNPDAVPHNWVLAKPGSLDRVGQLANKFIADPSAFLKQYVPESDDVLCYTNIVDPEQSSTIFFVAPKEPGRYPFLCSFPGHWMVMNGELIVE
jgi:putative heme-binding domain-containing protein